VPIGPLLTKTITALSTGAERVTVERVSLITIQVVRHYDQ